MKLIDLVSVIFCVTGAMYFVRNFFFVGFAKRRDVEMRDRMGRTDKAEATIAAMSAQIRRLASEREELLAINQGLSREIDHLKARITVRGKRRARNKNA